MRNIYKVVINKPNKNKLEDKASFSKRCMASYASRFPFLTKSQLKMKVNKAWNKQQKKLTVKDEKLNVSNTTADKEISFDKDVVLSPANCKGSPFGIDNVRDVTDSITEELSSRVEESESVSSSRTEQCNEPSMEESEGCSSKSYKPSMKESVGCKKRIENCDDPSREILTAESNGNEDIIENTVEPNRMGEESDKEEDIAEEMKVSIVTSQVSIHSSTEGKESEEDEIPINKCDQVDEISASTCDQEYEIPQSKCDQRSLFEEDVESEKKINVKGTCEIDEKEEENKENLSLDENEGDRNQVVDGDSGFLTEMFNKRNKDKDIRTTELTGRSLLCVSNNRDEIRSMDLLTEDDFFL